MKNILFAVIAAFTFTIMNAEASMVKVLIIDDVFQEIPQENEVLVRMGKLQGDLLVKGSHYNGIIEVWKGDKGLFLINELPLEEYVSNVVSAEVGNNWDVEALKAQAVIVRTYALHKIKYKTHHANYDLTSSILHQIYKGSNRDPQIANAVSSTQGEILKYDGEVIESLYHSTCGGRTEIPEEVFSRSYPYLKSVESNCELSPYWIWERKISLREIEKALDITGIKDIRISSYTKTGRVKTLAILHANTVLSIKAAELRKTLGWKRLPSTKFDIAYMNGNVIFEGKGYGHGVGLCQWSALQMSRNGMNYKDILAFFYPGTSIEIYENL
jgi:stage II sporulation protein D